MLGVDRCRSLGAVTAAPGPGQFCSALLYSLLSHCYPRLYSSLTYTGSVEVHAPLPTTTLPRSLPPLPTAALPPPPSQTALTVDIPFQYPLR